MIFTFALSRNPCRLLGGVRSPYRHVCGGDCEVPGLPEQDRFVHIATLDLRDPALAYLGERFAGCELLPLVMDTAEGWIAYSVKPHGILLHSSAESHSQPLMRGPLARQDAALVPFTYEQYRAAAFASAVLDESFLRKADRDALASLGEDYSQIGGAHRFDNGAAPSCQNPECLGYPHHGTDLFASLQKNLAPGVSLDYCPNDPALHFFVCGQCGSMAGEVAL